MGRKTFRPMKAREHRPVYYWVFAVYRVDTPTQVTGVTIEATTEYLARRQLAQRYGAEYRSALIITEPKVVEGPGIEKETTDHESVPAHV